METKTIRCTWTRCEDWYSSASTQPTTHQETSCGNKYKVIGRGWKYCPYCSKPIISDEVIRLYHRGKFLRNKQGPNDRYRGFGDD